MTSTMISVNIDRSEPLDLHDQVAAEIRRAIADGEAGPGDRLPLVKDMAAVLGVNKNTVLRAMHILRGEGLVEFRRGRGITVTGTPNERCSNKFEPSSSSLDTRVTGAARSSR